MKYYRCQCGKLESWGSMPPAACRACSECATTLAEAPGLHREPASHEFISATTRTPWGVAEGKVCKFCNRSPQELGINDEPVPAPQPGPQTLGGKVIDTIVGGQLAIATCAHDESHDCIVRWAANAEEQIEAAINSMKDDTP